MNQAVKFDGDGLTAADERRLSKQLEAVKRLMLDGRWRTLAHIALATGAPQASVSARLRDLRKEAFGGFKVERRSCGAGLYEYRVVLPKEDDGQLDLLFGESAPECSLCRGKGFVTLLAGPDESTTPCRECGGKATQ